MTLYANCIADDFTFIGQSFTIILCLLSIVQNPRLLGKWEPQLELPIRPLHLLDICSDELPNTYGFPAMSIKCSSSIKVYFQVFYLVLYGLLVNSKWCCQLSSSFCLHLFYMFTFSFYLPNQLRIQLLAKLMSFDSEMLAISSAYSTNCVFLSFAILKSIGDRIIFVFFFIRGYDLNQESGNSDDNHFVQ